MSQAATAPTGLNRAQRRALAQRVDQPRPGTRRPRLIMANAMQVVISRASRLTQAERAGVLQPARNGYAALRQGVATELDWAGCCSAVAVALAIDAQGVVKGLQGHLRAADQALHAIQQRAMASGTWQPTALYFDEMAAISEAIDLHDFQLQQLSLSELDAAIRRAERQILAQGGRAFAAPTTQPAPVQPALL